jgi:D-psicose/D-tagatose/L-ribulose 3-epimerase
MKVGFNMLLWTTHVTEEAFPLMEAIKKIGYDGVEIPL